MVEPLICYTLKTLLFAMLNLLLFLRKPKGYVGSDVRFKNQNIFLTWGTPDTLAKSKYVKKFKIRHICTVYVPSDYIYVQFMYLQTTETSIKTSKS